MDVEIFESGKKKSLIQKYRNKGRRGLRGFYYFLFYNARYHEDSRISCLELHIDV